MQYLDQEGKVVSTSKARPGLRSGDGKSTKVFDAPVSSTGQALEWLAVMCSHIPIFSSNIW